MNYISVADTAKLIRKDLKRHFPAIKFSVRSESYSGGASINIYWTNGPTTDQVENVVCAYNGSGFDGMIDLKYSNSAFILESGEVVSGNSQGTENSGGYNPAIKRELPKGAKEVHFGADFIFCNRKIDPDIELEAALFLAHKHELKELPEMAHTEYGPYVKYPNIMIWNDWFSTIVHKWFSKVDLTEANV